MKIAIFTGAGISKESGIETFRDSKEGLWENYDIEEVATPEGFKKDQNKVIEFYNNMRSKLPEYEPSKAHILLKELEENHKVTIITQNVDDLHERAGSSNIIHIHGELTKVRNLNEEIIEIGYNNSNLRPHVVWFGETPYNVEKAYDSLIEADIVVAIGTSFSITYTLDLISAGLTDSNLYYIDPEPITYFEACTDNEVIYIKENATKGIEKFIKLL